MPMKEKTIMRQHIVGLAVVSLGSCATLAGAPAIASAAQTGRSRTVAFGTRTVSVPRDGIVVLDGEPVTVLPGARRIILVRSPSTSRSPDPLALPESPGEFFTFAPSDTTSTTVASVPAAPAASKSIPGCVLSANPPTNLPGQYLVQGTTSTRCVPPQGTDTITMNATLYWRSNSSTKWVRQAPPGTGDGTNDASAVAAHACQGGQSHQWKVRNNSAVENSVSKQEYSGYNDSTQPLIYCRA